MIYLDNAATTFPKPDTVYRAIDNASRNLAFNAGRGSYKAAERVLKVIDHARLGIANIAGVSPDNVTFTSSATEALNLIIYGLGLRSTDVVYVSPFEHNAIVRPLHLLEKNIGLHFKILPFDKQTWEPDMEAIENMFALERPSAIFISQVSNVTGLCLSYRRIFEEGKRFGSINILDCAQGFGVVPIEKSEKMAIDYAVFAGHKSLYASFGVAGFVTLSGHILNVIKSGGTGSDSLNPEMPDSPPLRYEAGSLNSIAIASLEASLDWLAHEDVFGHEQKLTKKMISELMKLKRIHVYLPSDPTKIIGVVSFSVDGYEPSDVGDILDSEFDICVRTGFHCSPLVHSFIGSKDRGGTVRASIGAFNTDNDVEMLIGALKSL